jgi:ABC-2 type transport system ATP-binding protein
VAKNVIEINKLSKHYDRLKAVDGISFEVREGEIFGLLGENGAGKSTTLEMIEGLRKPTSGDIKILGKDSRHNINFVKSKIGVQLQSTAYYQFLTLKEILELFCSLYSKCINPYELLSLVDLKDKARSYVGSLSGGQKQRFSIVAALVNDPKIVFLDEPTTGLDPLARRNLWKIIEDIKLKGKTIILTTHYMEEAEILCDRVGIMDRGKILALDETNKLIELAEYPFKISFVTSKPDGSNLKKLSKYGVAENVVGKKNQYILKVKNKSNLDDAIDFVRGINPDYYTIGKATLEDVFIELTGKTIDDD